MGRSRAQSLSRPFYFSKLFLTGVAEAALYCAHRTSTFLSCAFCEQEGHLAAPFPSFGDRALHEDRRSSASTPSHGVRSFPLHVVVNEGFRYSPGTPLHENAG